MSNGWCEFVRVLDDYVVDPNGSARKLRKIIRTIHLSYRFDNEGRKQDDDRDHDPHISDSD
jgi:hypothetical protein